MKILAINGSPRKNRNTATILENALNGAAIQGAETELIHLYDVTFKGCTSCLACKQKDGKSFGQCAVRDELTPILEKIRQTDALLLGSPIYFTSMTGEMRSFYERAAYPYLNYSEQGASLFPKKIKVGLILTIGTDENTIKEYGMNRHFELTEMMLGQLFGSAESLIVTDANVYGDYSKFAGSPDEAAVLQRRNEEQFAAYSKKAFDMGRRLVSFAE